MNSVEWMRVEWKVLRGRLECVRKDGKEDDEEDWRMNEVDE